MSHKDGFVFYRSFYEAGSCLNDSQFRELINAICQYALDSKEPDLNGVVSGMFQLIKPQIDANNKRYENGLKGGRPKKPNDNQTETKQKPNHNQTITKQKPNNNQSETKPKPKEKDKVKDLY